MFPQVIIVCVLLLAPGLLSEEPANRELTFSSDKMGPQGIQEKHHPSGRGSVLGPWESPNSALLDEFMIDTVLIHSWAPGSQYGPSIAFDGVNYLIVWEDRRTGVGTNIYGTRVSASGKVLDSSGIAISAATGSQYHPSVSFDGSTFLVVWVDVGSGGNQICGTRVDTSGTVLDTSGIPICTAMGGSWWPEVAYGGCTYLVVWHEFDTGTEIDIYGVRVNASGTVLDSAAILICGADSGQAMPALTSDGSNFFVVWEDWRNVSDDIYGARVDTAGVVLDTNGIPICTTAADQGAPSVCHYETGYFVTWSHYLDGSNIDIRGARVTASGTLIDTSAIVISTAPFTRYGSSVAFTGGNLLVAWEDYRDSTAPDIYGSRVDTSGIVLDPSGLQISTMRRAQQSPCVSSDGASYFVAWGDSRGNGTKIYGSGVDTSGAVVDSSGIMISTAGHGQFRPSGAFDDTAYMIVWEDCRRDSSDIYGARVDPSGHVLDPVCIPICAADFNQSSPSVAFGAGNYLAVWEDSRTVTDYDIYGCRVDRDGGVLDPGGIPISTAIDRQRKPAIAFGGTQYLIVWEDWRHGYGDMDVYGARVDTSGVVLDSGGIVISGSINRQELPRVTSNGEGYLVVWQHHRGGLTDIYGTRVTLAGEVIDSTGIEICATPFGLTAPDVASDGRNYLVVWEEGREWYTPRIYGARVDEFGTVLDTAAIAIGSAGYDQLSPSVAFDGRDFVVVWYDYRYGYPGIFGAKVDTAGRVVDTLSVDLGDATRPRRDPIIVTGPDDQVLLAYEGFAYQPYNTRRIFGAFHYGVGVSEQSQVARCLGFTLAQNLPNPFRGQTTLQYGVQTRNKASLKVYDSSGRLVKTLVDGDRPAGSYSVTWNGKDESGSQLPSGIYFCRLRAGDATATRKMILIR